jgi:TRAP-type C4-dicarboxylate transport system permease small subunit
MQTLMKFVKGIHYGTLNIERAIVIFLLLSLTATMFAQTVARYVIGKGFFAIEQFVGYFAVWLYFIGSAYAAYERTQVSAEIVSMIFKSERTLAPLAIAC